MKCLVWSDEWWPVLIPEPKSDGTTEVPEQLVKRFQAAVGEMSAVQAELREIVRARPPEIANE